MAAIFDLDAILEFQPYWHSDILKQPPSWNCLNCVNNDFLLPVEPLFYRVISVYRKTVMIFINGCNRLVTVLDIIMNSALCIMVADI